MTLCLETPCRGSLGPRLCFTVTGFRQGSMLGLSITPQSLEDGISTFPGVPTPADTQAHCGTLEVGPLGIHPDPMGPLRCMTALHSGRPNLPT